MHGAFVEQIVAEGELIELNKNERDHLFKTLRANLGDMVKILDGQGGTAIATVVEDRQLAIVSCQKVETPKLRIHLACAAPRRQKLDVLLKQLAEVGAWQIDLIACQRSVAKPEGKERWQTLLQEGCKQSGNPFLTKISSNLTLTELLKKWQSEGVTQFYGAIPEDNELPRVPTTGVIGFLVGPEGGFTDEELAQIEAQGATAINLGPWILRLETAALCGITALRVMAK